MNVSRRAVLAALAVPAPATPLVSCATRVRVPTDLHSAIPGGCVSRLAHVLARGPVTRIRFGYVNWVASSAGDRPGPGPITVRAALQAPGGTFAPITFAGADHIVLPPGATVLSDPASCRLRPGDVFTSLTALLSDGAFPVNADLAGGAMPDGFLAGAADPAAPVPAADRTVWGFGPSVIVGDAPGPAVAIVGDSIAWGASDSGGDRHRNRGWPERLLADRAGLLNLSRGGDTAANFAAHTLFRPPLLGLAGITSALVTYGTNDLATGHDPAQVRASLAAVWSVLAGQGVRRIVQATVLPRTVGGRAVLAPGAREAVNDWIRSRPAPLAQVLDAAAEVEDGWGGLTDDGTHPNDRGAAFIAARLDAGTLLPPR